MRRVNPLKDYKPRNEKGRHRFDALFVQMLPYCTLKPYQLSKRARHYEEAENYLGL